MSLNDHTKLKNITDVEELSFLKKYPLQYPKLQPGINFFSNMTYGYFKDSVSLMDIIKHEVKYSIADTVLICCMFAKTLLEETKVEHAKLEYTFLISNKKNNDIIKGNKGNPKKTEYVLSRNSNNDDNSSDKCDNVLSAKDIIEKSDKLYRTIGLLKGHYTLLNKKNRIIGILPDDTFDDGIYVYNILNLRIAPFEADDESRSSMTIMTKITKELEDVCGIVISSNRISVIFKGREIIKYDKYTAKWETPIAPGTWEFLGRLIEKCFKNQITDKNKEAINKIKNTVKKISDSDSVGAIIVLGNIKNEENNVVGGLKKYSSQSSLIQEFSEKTLLDIDEEDLFDICILDGATLIDINSLEVQGRVTLRPKFAFNNANIRDEKFFTKDKDFDVFEIHEDDLNWTEKGRRFSFGTRHQNGLGMAFCTHSLTIIISSTGEVTTFYPCRIDGANGEKNYKVQGYSLLGLADITITPAEPNWPGS